MEKRTPHSIVDSRPVVTIEVDREWAMPATWWRLNIRVPSAPSHFSRIWPTPNGRLSQSQWDDISSQIAKTILDALLANGAMDYVDWLNGRGIGYGTEEERPSGG